MTVTLTRTGHVAEVTLNRPEKLNAVDASILEGLVETGRSIQADRSIRAVVLTGAGKSFSAGIDMDFLKSSLDPASFRDKALTLPEGEIANYFQAPAHVWKEVEVPVICALSGVAFGAGCQIALGADLRIAARDARLSIMEMKWGLVPDMSVMTTLPDLMRLDQAKDLVLTGRIVEADEALSLGLVTRLSDTPLEDARAYAEELAGRSPDAVRAAKKLVQQGWNAPHADAMRLEAELQATLIGTPNQMEAVMSVFQKRPANYKD